MTSLLVPTEFRERRKRLADMVADLTHKCRRLNDSMSEARRNNDEFQWKMSRVCRDPDSEDDSDESGSNTSMSDSFINQHVLRNQQHESAPDNPKAMFKCQKCQLNIQGPRINLHLHMAKHEIARLECPISGCGIRLTPTASYKHLVEVHRTSVRLLSAEETEKHERTVKAFTDEMNRQLEKYFPADAYLGEAGVVAKTQFANTCNECQKVVRTDTGKKTHVSMHLSLKLKCPFEGCERILTLKSTKKHFLSEHSKKVSALSQEEDLRYREEEKAANDIIDAERHRFFSIVAE
ncbi:hypothetical protein QR680_006860 [Steinernema hermaphroditum]|uniref:C2H2-type domain-containing protein n=1 Tax=Steinernema hermaphroditum TaxID=289476 RepID=A0AA39LY26_9BILA|nr:hypothetical protein QR680_006860 [Steinernema hermaphroditum]